LVTVELTLGQEYDVDPDEFTQARREIMAQLPDEFDFSEPPASTPEPSQVALEILSSSTYERYEWLHIVGEVLNEGSVPMSYVKIVATLYNAEGDVVGTGFTYTALDVIPPGGKAPFDLGTDEYAGFESYKLQVQGDPGELGRQDLVILSHSTATEYDWLHIRGEVSNTGSTDAEYVKIVATLYDAASNVIGVGFTYTELDVVAAGDTSPFDLGMDQWEGMDRYELQVQGD
jgi:hypothetical protein